MGTSGAPTEFTMGTPEDVKGLREQLIKLLQGGLGKGATPYSGPVAPQQNQMTLGAANMLSQMMGYGQYQQPGFIMNPYANAGGGGGGGGGGEDGGDGRTLPMKPYDEVGGQDRWGSTGADPAYPGGQDVGYGPGQVPPVYRYGSSYPAGYDPLNNPYGWQDWMY